VSTLDIGRWPNHTLDARAWVAAAGELDELAAMSRAEAEAYALAAAQSYDLEAEDDPGEARDGASVDPGSIMDLWERMQG
jgi:hypothetical protein